MINNKFGKLIGCMALVGFLTACNQTPAEKEVIVVPTTTTEKVIIEKEPAAKSTTITLDKKGVKVEAEKIDVSIQK